MDDDSDIFNDIFSHELAIKSPLSSCGCLGKQVGSGVAVDVGTHRGDFAHSFLSEFNGTLFCVDPYRQGYDDSDPISSGERHLDFLAASNKLMDFLVESRVEFIIQPSNQAVTRFTANSINFVHIDGHRKYDSITEDLELWYDKLRVGGIIAGCGIADELGQSWQSEVKEAVMDFVQRLHTPPKVHIICDPDAEWSYYFKKL